MEADAHQPVSPETILIVRPGALGDTILSLPLLATIRSEHPGSQITFLGNRSYQNLLPTEIEFQSIDAPRWLWLFGPASDREASRAFDRAYVILNRAEEVNCNLVNAGTKSVMNASSTPPQDKHVVEHLHEAFGFPVPARYPALMEIAPAEKSDIIWIHPGSGGPRKCLPLTIMAGLAKILRVRTGLALAITAGEADGFLKVLPEWERLTQGYRTQLMENRPLIELNKELGRAKLFVGNDSGISHLAAGLGVPSAVFFTASDPIQWSPWVSPEQLRIIDCREGRAVRLDLEEEARRILDFAGL
jgi:ADP-heptose:LPS heptosyltransferase